MKVALVYDRVNKWGGAERILLALHDLFPEAPLYTAFYNQKNTSWANAIHVIPSFLQKFTYKGKFHEFFAWATPIAFESFDFSAFDVVISITSAEAKNIITLPQTLHICYCLTPTRYLWSGHNEYIRNPGFGLLNSFVSKILRHSVKFLRDWDQIAANRPDMYIAISQTIKKRIETYYHRSVDSVIYPPVDTDKFIIGADPESDFYLVVSRFVGYKRIDLIVQAFNELGLPLLVIGNGSEAYTLKQMAHTNVKIITDNLTDGMLLHYYQTCRAFIFAGMEDFGLVAAEVQACGKPVIGYAHGGMAEIVQPDKTGILFEEQSVASIIAAVQKSQSMTFDKNLCRINAIRFSLANFKKSFYNLIVKNNQLFQKGTKL